MRGWLASSLQRKLSVVIAGSMIVPLLALGLFAFMFSSRVTEEKTKLTGSDMLEQMDANLRFILEDAETLSLFLIGERDIQSYLARFEDRNADRTEIIGRMTNLAASKSYIANIAIYPDRFGPPLMTAAWFEGEIPIPSELSPGGGKAWSGVYPIQNYSGVQNVITLVRPIRSVYNFQHLGWLAISLDEEELSRNWSHPDFGQGSETAELVSGQGTILSSPDKSRLGRPLEGFAPGLLPRISEQPDSAGSVLYGEGDSKVTVLFHREPLTGWMLVGTVPYERYREQNRYILFLTGAAVAVSVAISASLVWFTVRRITRPLAVLTRHLSRIDPERPLPRFPTAGKEDEIGRLGRSYNLLGAHIERLKQEVVRGEARKKEADLRALQAQINPHFLYNTLSSIHWIALMSEEKRIADMVEGLSDFLRISLNQGKEFCPVGQELEHIRNYVRVQSIRFPGEFTVDYIVDPALEERRMLKLLLQPLVENALIHGIQKKGGPGTITVLIQPESERMRFTVLDDGAGMSPERLAEIRLALKEKGAGSASASAGTSGYGLCNVNERLLLHYGPGAMLEVDSRAGGGTRVSFSIPSLEVSYESADRG
ncbi:sensor histidine kinase [Paenibacillus sp. M1]|uniref:histidine kinase n=1 Tax=Paenibacillus haidiansis TaxID=1574488 RepID=A0ABU7VRB7_9BACL